MTHLIASVVFAMLAGVFWTRGSVTATAIFGVLTAGNVVLSLWPEKPGNKENEVRDLAYNLWERAGRPECDGKEFWHEAERRLK